MNIEDERKKRLDDFSKILNYKFKNIHHLNLSLTHSSYANENKKKKQIMFNERLEFLGDSVLDLIISERLYLNVQMFPEGELTKIRASIVCESSLANCAKKLKIGEYILLGKGEEITGGRNRASILADTLEAIIGAIYIDGGYDLAKKFVSDNLKNVIEDAIEGKIYIDYKTQLQEKIQSRSTEKIVYKVKNEEGPDHNKTFYINVEIGDKVFGTGIGKSKKEAEQSAAKNALNILE